MGPGDRLPLQFGRYDTPLFRPSCKYALLLRHRGSFGYPLPLINPLLSLLYRDAMAELLGCPEKVDWKKCELSKDDELRMVENLKADFAPLDPALEG